MTDAEIVRGLSKLQAQGELGAAQARCYLAGTWLPRSRLDFGLICAALLKLSGPELKQQFKTRRTPQGTEGDAAQLLAALRGQA